MNHNSSQADIQADRQYMYHNGSLASDRQIDHYMYMYHNGSLEGIKTDRPLHEPQWFSYIRKIDKPLHVPQWFSSRHTGR